jgi:acyl-coenzyme A thioesterase PaaI-like protein
MSTNDSTPSTHNAPLSGLKQPNSRHCFVCGVENPFGLMLDFYETGSGEVTVETTVPEHFQGYPGIVHGGIVAALVDEVLGRVHMGTDPEKPRFMYTAKLTIQYRKSVPTNQPIKITGRAIRSKKFSATSVAEIYNSGGELLVQAEALLVNVPEETINSVDLESLGWRVYPDQE